MTHPQQPTREVPNFTITGVFKNEFDEVLPSQQVAMTRLISAVAKTYSAQSTPVYDPRVSFFDLEGVDGLVRIFNTVKQND